MKYINQLNDSVPLPKNTVITHHKNGTDYVFLTIGYEYKKRLKRSEPKRMSIGKLNAEGRLIPNKNFSSLLDRYTYFNFENKE